MTRPFRLLLLLLLFAAPAGAQTHAIAHKSHGGSGAELSESLEGAEADFGRMVEREITSYRVDSIILLSDSTALTVTGTYKVRRYEPEEAPRRVRARVDTLRFTPPACGRPTDSLKRALKASYGKAADSVRFVGFGEEAKQPGVIQRVQPGSLVLLPAGGGGTDEPGAPPGLPLVLAGIALLASVLTGFIAWLYRRTPLVS